MGRGSWQTLTAIIVYELIVAVVAVASLGLFLISRADPPTEIEKPPRGAHVGREHERSRSGLIGPDQTRKDTPVVQRSYSHTPMATGRFCRQPQRSG
jgi:hypothetical protein